MIKLLEKGEIEAGARHFMPTIAFVPGAWVRLPDEARRICIFTPPTYLDEGRDPEWLAIDLQRLANFSQPALLAQGDQSEPFFPLVLDEITPAIRRVQRRTLSGAGYVPQFSHPEEYVDVVTSFIRNAVPGPTI